MSNAALAKDPLELTDLIDVSLTAVIYAARDINLYEFRALDGQSLPPAEAGCHIDLHLPNGLARQYSLITSGDGLPAYLVGIKRDAQGSGASLFIHDQLRVGTRLKIGAPRNNFPLYEAARHTLLIAGGIGVTPIWCMAKRLTALGRSWELHYSVRSRADAAFLEEMRPLSNVHLHVDDECDGKLLDLVGLAAAAPEDCHLYCCGPTPMLHAFETATQGRRREAVHVEYFTAKTAAATSGGFCLELSKSGLSLAVPAGRSILEIIRAAGIDLPSSCEQGVCGACEVRVLGGIPDHRDAILSEAERRESKTMMVCCSGAKSDTLVLDL